MINKIDAEGVDLPKLLSELKEAFGDGVLPINLPAKGMTRVIDCFDRDTGESDIMTVSDVHRAFIERVVEVDDATMEKYLEEGDADPSTLHAPITKALREGHIIPGVLHKRQKPDRYPRPHQGHHPPYARTCGSQCRALCGRTG